MGTRQAAQSLNGRQSVASVRRLHTLAIEPQARLTTGKARKLELLRLLLGQFVSHGQMATVEVVLGTV